MTFDLDIWTLRYKNEKCCRERREPEKDHLVVGWVVLMKDNRTRHPVIADLARIRQDHLMTGINSWKQKIAGILRLPLGSEKPWHHVAILFDPGIWQGE